jgi:hypothetical protein
VLSSPDAAAPAPAAGPRIQSEPLLTEAVSKDGISGTTNFSLSFRRRIDVDNRPATLIVKYEGERVLIAQWTIDGFTRRSYSPGRWEGLLSRCDRLPEPLSRL